MNLHANCGDDRDCGCNTHSNDERSRHSMRVNISGDVTKTTYDGRDFLVVPVVMIKSDVVMNSSLVPSEELFPDSWNGVPVTVGHPADDKGDFLSANSPDTLTKYSVGTIFNSRWDKGTLKAEAWVDIEKANRVRPGLVDMLEKGEPLDVSTGYFSADEQKKGSINGRSYTMISRNLNPDHLALLPDETGACSWEDGCGVRANKRNPHTMSKKVQGALDIIKNALSGKTNARGDDSDPRTVIADLIADPNSPFTPDDSEALMLMKPERLIALRDEFAAEAANEEAEGDSEVETDGKPDDVVQNKEEDQTVADKAKDAKANASGLPATKDELATMIANAVAAAVKPLSANALTADDRSALERAHKINADHKTGLIDTIVANSKMTKEAAEKLDVPTLELFAASLDIAAPDYSGRGFPIVNAADKDDAAVLAMTPPSAKDAIINSRKLRGEQKVH